MRACDWRLEQEFAAEAFDGSTLYPQSGNDRNGFVTGTNQGQWVRNRHQPGQYDREFKILFHRHELFARVQEPHFTTLIDSIVKCKILFLALSADFIGTCSTEDI